MKLGRVFPSGFLLSISMMFPSVSAEWPNEPAGSDLVLDCPFTGGLCAGMFNVYKNLPFVNITLPGQQPASPTGVLDYSMPVGSGTGGGQFGYDFTNNLGHTVREVYLATWWATNSDFVGVPHGNKMLFISADGNNNYLGWYGAKFEPKQLFWVNQSINNNCHVSGWVGDCGDNGTYYGTGSLRPNGPHNGVVAAGSGWHRIEIYQKASTSATSRDGIIRIWVDGSLSTNYTNLNHAQAGFHSVQYNSTWGLACEGTVVAGYPPQWYRDCSKEWHHYYDHLRVSIPHGAGTITMPLAITSSLPAMQEGKFYSTTFGAANGKAPYAWTISAGSIPPGLTLNKTTGVLSGIPTTIGRSDFTVKVMDSSVPPAEATKAFTMIVSRSTGIGKREATVNGSQLTAEPRAGGVAFGPAYSGDYLLSVYDLTGREVWRRAGSGEAVWNHGGKLTRGVYLVRAEQNGKVLKSNYCHVW